MNIKDYENAISRFFSMNVVKTDPNYSHQFSSTLNDLYNYASSLEKEMWDNPVQEEQRKAIEIYKSNCRLYEQMIKDKDNMITALQTANTKLLIRAREAEYKLKEITDAVSTIGKFLKYVKD